MGTVARFFNHASKPVSVAEFKDAVEAVCRPRFPMARAARQQRIVLAISGGVDSMAMAYLFSKTLKIYKNMKIVDNPCHGAVAVVIDHGLRDGSDEEAAAVATELRRLEIKTQVIPLSWKDERKLGLDPRNLPNLEGLARTYRYRQIGRACYLNGASSLFFAHHRDDQYETVLMRLIGGHGYRGLQGIKPANSIPECYDSHGVYKSGLIDDQLRVNPFLSFRPPAREMRRLRSIFRDERLMDPLHGAQLRPDDVADRFPDYVCADEEPRIPFLKPLDTEDGGAIVYRPLLGFDKDRLIATCEANGVKWFEDHTNLDPTLTTRNAIRYLVRNHELPRALQKPAILNLSRKSMLKTKAEEAEARRFLIRETVIKEFDPNAGTLLVKLPLLKPTKSRLKRQSLGLGVEARREHVKIIMANAIRKLIEFVTPEHNLPPLANLENVLQRLFSDLRSESKYSEPKAFVVAGVLFDPIISGSSVSWFLSRTPFPSNRPLPTCKLHGSMDIRLRTAHQDGLGYLHSKSEDNSKRLARTLSWKKAKLFDGRFWIRVGFNNKYLFRVQPFQPEDAKRFRKSIPAVRRERLEQLLKYYAPSKVRYTLPGLYCIERKRNETTGEVTNTTTLLALPTLGIHLPGLERWVRYDVRYKQVDRTLLGHGPRGSKKAVMRLTGRASVSRGRRPKRRSRLCVNATNSTEAC